MKDETRRESDLMVGSNMEEREIPFKGVFINSCMEQAIIGTEQWVKFTLMQYQKGHHLNK